VRKASEAFGRVASIRSGVAGESLRRFENSLTGDDQPMEIPGTPLGPNAPEPSPPTTPDGPDAPQEVPSPDPRGPETPPDSDDD
jgi:hypothetical protein